MLSDGEPDLLLGAGAAVRATHSRVLPAGSTLILYTDGLIEHRSRSIDQGLAEVLHVVGPLEGSAQQTCDALFDAKIAGPTDDDVAAIVTAAVAQAGAAGEGMKAMGKVMGLVQPQVKGRADGGAVAAEVRRQLG